MNGTLAIHRGYRFRLAPTLTQEAVLEQYCGVVRAVYNSAREQREHHWRRYQRCTGTPISFFSQSAEIKSLRAAFDWIATAPTDCLHYALRDLDRAYRAFFAGTSRYPTPRRRSENDSFKVRGVNTTITALNRKWATVRIPKLGPIKFRSHRAIQGRVVSVTVSRGDGGWWVSFSTERELNRPQSTLPSVGIDRGITQTLTLSTGEVFQAPAAQRLLTRRKRHQRSLARRKKGSSRYGRQKAAVAKTSAKIARVRVAWCHEASTSIASRFGAVALEALNIKNMTASAAGTLAEPGRRVGQKAGLNRSILEQSWGRFARYLGYKLAERGGSLINVPAAYTSQTCSACGVVDGRSRKSQAVFDCIHCGHIAHADINAACEILRRSTASTDVERLNLGASKRQPSMVASRGQRKPAVPGMLLSSDAGDFSVSRGAP